MCLPAAVSEWWFWEYSAFMAGQNGTVALAAHSICYSVIPLAFMLPLGCSIGLAQTTPTEKIMEKR